MKGDKACWACGEVGGCPGHVGLRSECYEMGVYKLSDGRIHQTPGMVDRPSKRRPDYPVKG